MSRNGTKRHDLTIFASHFRDRVHLTKVPLGVRLISTRRRPPRVFYHTSANVPEEKFLVRGCPPLHPPAAGPADATTPPETRGRCPGSFRSSPTYNTHTKPRSFWLLVVPSCSCCICCASPLLVTKKGGGRPCRRAPSSAGITTSRGFQKCSRRAAVLR